MPSSGRKIFRSNKLLIFMYFLSPPSVGGEQEQRLKYLIKISLAATVKPEEEVWRIVTKA